MIQFIKVPFIIIQEKLLFRKLANFHQELTNPLTNMHTKTQKTTQEKNERFENFN